MGLLGGITSVTHGVRRGEDKSSSSSSFWDEGTLESRTTRLVSGPGYPLVRRGRTGADRGTPWGLRSQRGDVKRHKMFPLLTDPSPF